MATSDPRCWAGNQTRIPALPSWCWSYCTTAGAPTSFSSWCSPDAYKQETVLPFLFLWLLVYGCIYTYFFIFFRAALEAYGGSQARGRIEAVAASLHHHHSNARSESCLQPTTTGDSNAGFLTHWAKPGIEPTTSRFLVGIVSTVPRWEFPVFWFFFFEDFCIYVIRHISL